METSHATEPVIYKGKPVDGHRLAEFIYGTVTAMVAVAGLSHDDGLAWSSSMAIIVVGAIAVWLAHAYSGAMSQRLLKREVLTGSEVAHELRKSAPIVSAGVLVSVPMLLAAIGLVDVHQALSIANGVGIAILILVGFMAGRISAASWPRTIALAALSGGLGLLVLAVELLVH